MITVINQSRSNALLSNKIESDVIRLRLNLFDFIRLIRLFDNGIYGKLDVLFRFIPNESNVNRSIEFDLFSARFCSIRHFDPKNASFQAD